MINTFIENKLTVYNRLFLKSFLSNGFSVCVWTYDVETIKDQIMFGVKVKDANDIVPFYVYKEIKKICEPAFLEYFKFAYLHDFGGCFSNPTILCIKNNLMKKINRYENLLFGDDYYCKFLVMSGEPVEIDDNFIKFERPKQEFSRDMFFIIEDLLFRGDEKKRNKYFEYTRKIQFGNKNILCGKQYLRDLYYRVEEYNYKLSIQSHGQTSLSCFQDTFFLTENVQRNFNSITELMSYVDIRYMDFDKMGDRKCSINLLRNRIEEF